jgi:hypothetical protein
MPLLSVVIPTLDRPDTLRHALATLAAQTAQDCEFIIQNNGGNAEIAALVAALGDPRFRHFSTPGIVTMSENWEAALAQVRGDYVTFIGDDDGLLPDACAMAERLLADRETEILSWAPYVYYWPGYQDPGFRNRLVAEIDFAVTAERVPSRSLLQRFYGFQTHYSRLPMIYNSFIRRSVIERMHARCGRYFLGLSPDVTSGIVNAALTAEFVLLSRPLSVSGASQYSTGHNSYFRPGDALGSARGRRDFGPVVKDARLPDLDSFALFLAQDMLLAQQALFPDEAAVSLDFKALAQAVATGINDRPERYDETLGSIAALAARHGFGLDEIVVPPRSAERAPLGTGVTVRGAGRVLFRLDGDALGLASVADAARVMAQFTPVGDAAISVRSAALPRLTGQGLDFARGGSGIGALAEGWSEPEDWGVWSVAKTCRLRLRLDPVPTAPIRIGLACRAFVHERHPWLRVACSAGETSVGSWNFAPASALGHRSFRLDPGSLDADGALTLTFALDNPRSPAELGLNSDIRPLGLGLERLWIEG